MGRKRIPRIYMEVTQDKFSLPVAVADSVEELAEMRCVKENTIRSGLGRWKNGIRTKPKYIYVELNEEKGENDNE